MKAFYPMIMIKSFIEKDRLRDIRISNGETIRKRFFIPFSTQIVKAGDIIGRMNILALETDEG